MSFTKHGKPKRMNIGVNYISDKKPSKNQLKLNTRYANRLYRINGVSDFCLSKNPTNKEELP